MNNNQSFFQDDYSKRHHYLPVFYLKGFGNSKELLDMYNKMNGEILSNQDPESKFLVNHLNNYRMNGEVKFTLEESFFTPQDTEGSKLFYKIREADPLNDEISSLEKFELLQFVYQLYWRSPESNELFVQLINKEGLTNKYFGFYNEAELKFIPDEEIDSIKSQILNDRELQKVFKHILPYSNAAEQEIYGLFDKWNLITIDSPLMTIITGDRPFLINNNNISLNNIFNEFIFPVSKNKVLIISDKIPNFIDSYLILYINLAILDQAKQFIASSDINYILDLKEKYNFIKKTQPNINFRRNAFDFMYYQTKFNNFESFLDSFEKGRKIYLKNNN